jgi:NTP pyrophosphatase (non-canonical NTP hydrolase)
MECFGPTISADTQERNHRFLEEALELVQACGATQSEAHQLVDYVYGRPVGEKAQEVGGVMITLAALCLANDLDMHHAGETELARIWTKVEEIRAKQTAKPKHSPLLAAPETWKILPSLLMPAASDAEIAMFNRFCEVCEDFEAGGYDVPREMMKRLACIGLVRSCSFGRYETTEFGDAVRTLIGG